MPLDLTYHFLPTSECLAFEIPQRQLHRLLYETRSKSGPTCAPMLSQAFLCIRRCDQTATRKTNLATLELASLHDDVSL